MDPIGNVSKVIVEAKETPMNIRANWRRIALAMGVIASWRWRSIESA